ncbi:HNH endonuclease family protein [uncultured Leifsonia sp.]|uniref:HNH endonuclease family protein n=1 Tax=uncultured Leifsonia sp. TaxID=340359 RepID=UPI0025E75828|nr:HNH endonuclease family protein [uncultured Leifsonia sp.]
MTRSRVRGRRTAPWPVVAVALVLAIAGAGGYAALTRVTADGGTAASVADDAASSAPSAAAPAGSRSASGLLDAAAARVALAALPVKGRAPATGYDRVAKFGQAWLDVDRNGCDTRDDILARDLSGVTRRADCRVLSGTLADPYTGATIVFTRGQETSARVQIDHVVALLDAWETGAQSLSQERRVELANDPLELLAVDGRANQAKGAGDAATWLPPAAGFRCEYAARQVSVKTKYGLWVKPAEKAALDRVLARCR